jgi:hypothetical protein
MRKLNSTKIGLILAVLAMLGGLAYWTPPIHERLSWRLDFALAYLRGVISPVQPMPTALPAPRVFVTHQPTQTGAISSTLLPANNTPVPALIPTPTTTPIPVSVLLPAPAYEKQDINNCGPAALTMYLRYYGWQGNQLDIQTVIKPQREDRNVNVDELVYFARTHVGWLNVEYRVGGDLDLIKRLLAAGVPVMIEETFHFEEPYWPNDDLWAAHYFLITGYDDPTQTFTGQDSFYGADRKVPYAQLDESWQSFNRVYMLVFPPDRQETIKTILGANWEANANRQHALDVAQSETQTQPRNAFAWFNLGSNLVYFERYAEATDAFDMARNIGLPQRMLRYQFSPFLAYFHGGRLTDLVALTEYALKITPNAEEALLWHGWALYRQGKTGAAIADWRKALVENSTYQDAKYALDFVGSTP